MKNCRDLACGRVTMTIDSCRSEKTYCGTYRMADNVRRVDDPMTYSDVRCSTGQAATTPGAGSGPHL